MALGKPFDDAYWRRCTLKWAGLLAMCLVGYAMRTFSWAAMTALAFCSLAAQASELPSFIEAGAKVEKIAQGFRFTEGPVWDSRGWLLFSDIPASKIYRWIPGSRTRRGGSTLPTPLVGSLRVYHWPSGHSNGLALDRSGRLVICEHDRKISRLEADGTVATLAERFSNKRLNSPNDLVLKSDGSIYFTDPPYGVSNKDREIEFSGVYRITADGRLSLVEKGMPFPNGIAFSPDESKLYVVDSGENNILVFDVQPDGSVLKPHLFAEVKLAGSNEGPDGIKVDRFGNVFCAGPDGIWILGPDGRLLEKIPMPEVPSNLAFGDADGSSLYITARTGLYRIKLRSNPP